MQLKKPITLLLIEDDRVAQLAFKRLVTQENLSYAYDIASSIGQTLDYVKNNQYDIVITDYLLGDGTAFDIIDVLRDTPLIFITGAGDEEIAVKALRAGAYDYLTKDLNGNYLTILPVTVENALRRKEAEKQSNLLSHAMTNITDNVYITNKDRSIIFINKAFTKTYGYAIEEIITQSADILWDTLPAGYSEEGNLYLGEFYHKRKNGEVFPVSLTQSLLTLDENHPMIVSVGRDISEKKAAEEALQESEKRYRNLFNAVNDPIFVHELLLEGSIGRLIEVNDFACQMLDYSRQELLSPDRTIETPTDHLNDFPPFMLKLLKEKQLLFNSYIVTKEGEYRIVEVNSLIYALNDEKIVLSIARDITERKKAEDALMISEDKYRNLFETALVGIFRSQGKTGEFLMANHTFLSMLGYDIDLSTDIEPITANLCIKDIMESKARKQIYVYLLKHRSIIEFEAHIKTIKGEIVPILLHARYYPDEDTIEGTAINISKLKETELRLRNALDEMEMLQSQIVQSSKMAAIGEMAAGMAHELNQGIAAIMSFAQTLGKMAQKEDFRKNRFVQNLEYIVSLSKKTADIINELRSFARPSRRDYSDIDMNTVIQEALVIMKDQFKSAGIHIHLELFDPLPCIYGNGNQLEQVVVNFMSNAKDAMENSARKHLYIKTYVPTQTRNVVLEITDTGHGIPKEVMDNIFIPFFTTKDREKGTGLGLSICYKIIKEHHGLIEPLSKPEKGTTFKLVLPQKNDKHET